MLSSKKVLRTITVSVAILIVILCALYLFIARPIIFPPQTVSHDVSVSENKLKQHLIKLSEEFSPRDWKNIENLNKTAEYIESEFRKYTNEVEIQTYTHSSKEFKNVIAKFGTGTENLIVIGAHYDAFEDLPAADDNASGVAGLLELASLLSKRPVKAPIHLVAYTLEEPPFFATELMGSAYHAKSLEDQNIKPRLMISLEMIGYFSEEKDSQKYPMPLLKLFYPSVGNFLCIVGDLSFGSPARSIKKHFMQSTDLPAYSINAPNFIPGVDFSDHRNYWSKDINAVMITDTAFYRNFNYHTPEDTYEKLDYEKMAKVIEGLYFYLSRLG